MILFFFAFIFSEKIKAINWSLSTQWLSSTNLQTIWTLWSFVVAVIVGWIGYNFNRTIKIQNKLAFEEFRPKLIVKDLDPSEGRYMLKNSWDFEADNVVIYSISYTQNDAILSYKRKEIASSLAKDWQIKITIDAGTDEYQTNILIYTNRASGIVYFNGYNLCTTDSESISAIGEKFSNWNKSPMWTATYIELSKLLRLSTQIENNESTSYYYAILEQKLRYYFL